MLFSRMQFMRRNFALKMRPNKLESIRRHETHFRSGALKPEPKKIKTPLGFGVAFVVVVPCILLGFVISSLVSDFLDARFDDDD